MDCHMPVIPVLHHLPEFAQTHVHWVYDAIQPSHPVTRFFSCPQSFPASGSFPMSRLFDSGGESTGASTSVLPMNIQDRFPLGLTGLISLLLKGLSSVFSSTTVQKHHCRDEKLQHKEGKELATDHQVELGFKSKKPSFRSLCWSVSHLFCAIQCHISKPWHMLFPLNFHFLKLLYLAAPVLL